METKTTSALCARCRDALPAEGAACTNCGFDAAQAPHVPWWHIHRRMYDWTLAWAYRPSASWALFWLSFAQSSFFLVPPDVLLAPLTLGNRRKWLHYAFLCSVGSVLGAIAGYLIGWLLWAGIEDWAFRYLAWMKITPENFAAAQQGYETHNFWVVFIAGFTPVPFKVFTIAAGALFQYNPPAFLVFVVASLVSRSLRFYLLAGLMRLFGDRAMPFIDKYFNWLALAFTILLIGGFWMIKFMR